MLTHKGTQRLESKHLVLRRFTQADGQAMYDNWCSDPDVTKFLTWPTYQSSSDADSILQSWVQSYEKPDFYQWAIVLKESGDMPIGSISTVHIHEKAETAEIGYCIGKAWWHRGIMTEALSTVMDFLFEDVGMNRIEARHDPNNPHSGAVMKKCGMRLEGRTRQSDWNNTGICDTCIYGILKEERR